MKAQERRRPRVCKTPKASKQKKMDGNYYVSSTTTYLVEIFALNSYDRKVSRTGEGRRPDPSFRRTAKRQLEEISRAVSGQKCRPVDLDILTSHFTAYCRAVNLILEKVYSTDARAERVGNMLTESRSRGYVVLMKEQYLKWKKTNEFGRLVFGRMHRNALETAARIIEADHSRSQLVRALLQILNESENDIDRLIGNKRIPADLVRRVRDMSAIRTKNRGTGFHYALSACKQVRRVIDDLLLVSTPTEEEQSADGPQRPRALAGRRGRRRTRARELWKKECEESERLRELACSEVGKWEVSIYHPCLQGSY